MFLVKPQHLEYFRRQAKFMRSLSIVDLSWYLSLRRTSKVKCFYREWKL